MRCYFHSFRLTLSYRLSNNLFGHFGSVYIDRVSVGLFVWIFNSYFKLGVIGVWFGIAAVVFTEWLLALFIVAKVTNSANGGLR
jgi:hypothetical protein